MGPACIFRVKNSGKKRCQGLENSQPGLVPELQQCVSLLQLTKAYSSPQSLKKKKILKSLKLGKTPSGRVKIHCACACCRNRLIVL